MKVFIITRPPGKKGNKLLATSVPDEDYAYRLVDNLRSKYKRVSDSDGIKFYSPAAVAFLNQCGSIDTVETVYLED